MSEATTRPDIEALEAAYKHLNTPTHATFADLSHANMIERGSAQAQLMDAMPALIAHIRQLEAANAALTARLDAQESE